MMDLRISFRFPVSHGNSPSRVPTYGILSPEFATRDGVRWSCPPSLFTSNFNIGVVMKKSLSSRANSGVDICSVKKLLDLRYADNFLLLSKDSGKLQVFLQHLSDSGSMFMMLFSLSNCKMPLQDWSDSNENNFLAV